VEEEAGGSYHVHRPTSPNNIDKLKLLVASSNTQ
jgi:hypothetical protein